MDNDNTDRSLQAASQAAQQNDYRYKLPMGWNAAVAMARGAELFDRIDIQPAILVMIDDMLAAAPQQPAQQVPLTDKAILEANYEFGIEPIICEADADIIRFGRAIEAAHGVALPPAAKEQKR
jgi:hypothetical protein